MAAAHSSAIDDYIASQPEAVRKLLVRVRAAIRKGAPTADEVIAYQIPALRLPAGVLLYFAGWKKHYSLYPVNEPLLAEFEKDLAPYDIDKGTIRFPLDEPVPVALITRITKFRVQQLGQAVAQRLAKKTEKAAASATRRTKTASKAAAGSAAKKKTSRPVAAASRGVKKSATTKKQTRKL